MNVGKQTKPKKNVDLRVLAIKNGVKWSEIASEIPVAPSTLSTWLQKELSKEAKDEIKEVILKIASRRDQEGAI